MPVGYWLDRESRRRFRRSQSPTSLSAWHGLAREILAGDADGASVRAWYGRTFQRSNGLALRAAAAAPPCRIMPVGTRGEASLFAACVVCARVCDACHVGYLGRRTMAVVRWLAGWCLCLCINWSTCVLKFMGHDAAVFVWLWLMAGVDLL